MGAQKLKECFTQRLKARDEQMKAVWEVAGQDTLREDGCKSVEIVHAEAIGEKAEARGRGQVRRVEKISEVVVMKQNGRKNCACKRMGEGVIHCRTGTSTCPGSMRR